MVEIIQFHEVLSGLLLISVSLSIALWTELFTNIIQRFKPKNTLLVNLIVVLVVSIVTFVIYKYAHYHTTQQVFSIGEKEDEEK